METKEVISFIMILALVGILGSVTIYISEKVDDKTALDPGVAASGTLTLSGNVSCNELVNITNVAGTKVTFEYNITSGGCTAATATYVTVTLAANQNTTTIAATNLTTIINANATIADTMTASSNLGIVTLTYDTIGVAGNSVSLAETLAAGAWSGTALAGGTATDTYYDTSQNVSGSVETGWSFTEIIVIALAAALIIAAIFSVIGGYIKL